MSKHTLFISDLHLQASQPDIVDIFRRFMQNQAKAADAVYILGDLFEVWIGDDDHTDFNYSIQLILKTFTSMTGIPVYLMHGNRDFLLGEGFARDAGCRLIADPRVIHLYGKSVLLKHGDDLCIDDKGHVRFRAATRHPVVQKVFLSLPLFFRRDLARKIRQISEKNNQSKPVAIMDVNAGAVERIMQAISVTQLIHGHTHRSAIHTLQVNGQAAQRIVLDAWHGRGSALVYYESGEYQFISIQ